MPAARIHHLNFVVRDLDVAMPDFERVLGVGPFEVIDHPARRARVARARIGETWLVLVCPGDPDSIPGRHLAEHGEGFFLLSLGVDDLEAELADLTAAGIKPVDAAPRAGIRDWRVADIGSVQGALVQLTQDAGDD